ncbi:MAG: FAD-binding protein [Candidatus Kapaibacterium sp.]|nr:MAG: FAD-binding protein [Candidatus Kapabacteria bacterium]
MKQVIKITLNIEEEGNEERVRSAIADMLCITKEDISAIRKLKRSLDARSRQIKVHLTVEVFICEIPSEKNATDTYSMLLHDVSKAAPVLIIGAGPAGLFAALTLIQHGIKPIILERGKNVQARRRDLATLNRQHIVHPDSNYCFGEGGAGTYSDGKLYTRSTKRGDVRSVLETLVAHGASADILVEAHPHIGTNKLPHIIQRMRERIVEAGGEVHFEQRVNDILLYNNEIQGVRTEQGQEFLANTLIMATGHSARDIFELLITKHIFIEQKPFAMGLRIEHPQHLIDSMQYRTRGAARHDLLPPASYSWVEQVQNEQQGGERGVFSFCMCPGGIIAPCATSATGEVVTNGWSPSKRNNPYANSGIVVAINVPDLAPYNHAGALAGLRFQQDLERIAWEAGGRTQNAPAQRLVDFVRGKNSTTLPKTSYQPGIVSAPLHELLPPVIGNSLRKAFEQLAKRMKPYFTNDAVVHGVESRTSSPVRIPRNPETLEHVQIRGLYPCAEGAGYAGGIVSAAIDGQKCAEAVAKKRRL